MQGEPVICHYLCAGREINLTAAVNKDTITRGLRYSIATGNWGMQGTAGIRAGVSQVLLRRLIHLGASVRSTTCLSDFTRRPSYLLACRGHGACSGLERRQSVS